MGRPALRRTPNSSNNLESAISDHHGSDPGNPALPISHLIEIGMNIERRRSQELGDHDARL